MYHWNFIICKVHDGYYIVTVLIQILILFIDIQNVYHLCYFLNPSTCQAQVTGSGNGCYWDMYKYQQWIREEYVDEEGQVLQTTATFLKNPKIIKGYVCAFSL